MLSLPLHVAPSLQENGPQFGGLQEPSAGMRRLECCEGRGAGIFGIMGVQIPARTSAAGWSQPTFGEGCEEVHLFLTAAFCDFF